MNPLRILHLVSSHRWTGAAEPAFGLAREQARLGHDVQFACVAGGPFERMVRAGASALWVDGLDLRPNAIGLARTRRDVRILRQLHANRQYDVVHCHLGHAHWLAALAFGRRRQPAGGRPLLVRTFHRDEPPRVDPLHWWLYVMATDLLITVSRDAEQRDARKLGLGADRVVCIPGAVDTDRFHPGVAAGTNRQLWSIPLDAPVAGMVAEMQPHRGHLPFLATLSDVCRAVPGARYLLAGDGEWRSRIDDAVAAHPLRAHIVAAGYRTDDLPDTYAAVDVAVILARGSDGSCRGMLEAMASGRPVIGANLGAIADAIEPGVSGWLVDPHKPAELVRALIDALADRARTAELGRAARRRIEARYTQRVRAEAVLAAYGK